MCTFGILIFAYFKNAVFSNLNPSVNKPIVSNLAFLSVKARREHHPTGLFPTSRSDTYE